MKPILNIALASALIASSTALGIWWGQHHAHNVALPAPDPFKATTLQASPTGPRIALPPALTEQPQEETLPAAGPAGPTEPANIIPGGAVAGDAVNRMWETTAGQPWQVRTTPITQPNWFITGVVQRGEKTQIIVQFDGEPSPRFLKIGDTLPGGGKLAWVRPDAIGIITPNRKRIGVSVLSDNAKPPLTQSTGPTAALRSQ